MRGVPGAERSERERRPSLNTRPHFRMGTPHATLGPDESYTHDRFVIVYGLRSGPRGLRCRVGLRPNTRHEDDTLIRHSTV